MSVVSTICPAIDLNLQHKDIKLESPSSVSVRRWVSTSYSNSQASFNMPPPSQTVFLDRCFVKETPVTITVAGSTSGTAMLQGGYDALRAYPIACITNSDQLTLNNQTFVVQTSELVPYMARYWKQSNFSSFPSMLDNYQVYADGVSTINNPLGTYVNAVNGNHCRGAYPMIIVNGATSSTITATIFEPVWVPVLHREFGMGVGLTNVKSCDLVTNYSSNLARIISHALSSATISSISVALGQPSIYQMYCSPPAGSVPRPMVYSSEDLNRFITPMATLTSNSSVTVQSTNMQLNAIPKWILVFVRESNANLTHASTDTACRIDNVSINFCNVSGILSSASSHDLWKLSKSNGLQDTWEQWYGKVVKSDLSGVVGTSGSFMKLMFGKDITLQQGEFPGKVGAYNLSLSVTVTNVNQSSSLTAPVLYVITSVPQKVIIHEGGQVESVLGISGEEGEYVPYNTAMEHYGGSFGDFIKKVGRIGSKVIGFLRDHKTISNIADMVAKNVPHPVAQQIASQIGSTARSLGFGDDMGGGTMSRGELMKRVRSYK